MIVKTIKGCNHTSNLEDVLPLVRKYDIHLNPSKHSFGVQAGIFIGFILTKRGIEANPHKCQVVITMKNPTDVNEV